MNRSKAMHSLGGSPDGFEEAFRGKSIFVTGHTGFKGSWLCMWLAKLQAQVTGYALAPPTEESNYDICQVGELLQRDIEADVRDVENLQSAIAKAKPDLVFHLAAQSIVREGIRQPRETFETNVMGTVNVLEAVRRLDAPCSVVCVTSDKCYENREQVWGYRESDAMGEHDPYGGSKGAAELAIRSYRHTYFSPHGERNSGIKIASGRAGNVIGGGDFTPHALLVDIFRSVASGKTIPIRMPLALRPWQHVLQALSGYMTLAARLMSSDDPKYQEGFNFGPLPGNEIVVKDVVEEFIKCWGSGCWEDVSQANQPHESTILRLAIDKAIWTLDWKPAWDIRQTLQQTAKWYRSYLDNQEMRSVSMSQIDAYTRQMTSMTEPPAQKTPAPYSIVEAS